MVTICTRLRLEPQVRAIAEKYAPVFYAAGTHPMSAADEPLASVEDLVANWLGIPNSWALAKPVWIITTPRKALMFKRNLCVFISRRRARPACR